MVFLTVLSSGRSEVKIFIRYRKQVPTTILTQQLGTQQLGSSSWHLAVAFLSLAPSCCVLQPGTYICCVLSLALSCCVLQPGTYSCSVLSLSPSCCVLQTGTYSCCVFSLAPVAVAFFSLAPSCCIPETGI